MSQANLPYRIIVAGDEWIDDQLLNADLSGYRAVVRFDPSYLSAEQEAKLQTAGERLVTWRDATYLINKVVKDIDIIGASNIFGIAPPSTWQCEFATYLPPAEQQLRSAD